MDLNSKLNVGFTFENGLTPEILLSAADFSARVGLCSTGIQFPLTGKSETELEIIIRINDSTTCEVNWDGNQVYLTGGEKSVVNALHYLATAKRYEEGGTFARWELANNLSVRDPEPLIYEKNWDNNGEKEDLLNIISKEKAADQVVVFISEPADIRGELAGEISTSLGASEVRVRSAFKPGFFWIEEEILPQLIEKQVDRIHIVCKKNTQGLEMANRWLQELYPVDEIIIKQLQITTDRIEFFLEEIEPIYELRPLIERGIV
ncbi:hypothetical protein RCG23_25695 [Neobacillus sp. PS3-34]|uniref:hypothetical protein n=1 Tax=Neobacillus sp. PS3-34 TaxID=3070678 RepID=UPI0027E00906|nr:hypothetical protein [Neobacillus sp. PS3-34]WML48570.1 hypothetical protein RCG23_25695 [Neobacillus sp. PS3-34]